MAETAIRGGVVAAVPHDSAAKHVAGEAIYIDDLPEPVGMLDAAVGLSATAHAEIVRMDLDKVRAAPGVVAVVTAHGHAGRERRRSGVPGRSAVRGRHRSNTPVRPCSPSLPKASSRRAAPHAWLRSSTASARRSSRSRTRLPSSRSSCRRTRCAAASPSRRSQMRRTASRGGSGWAARTIFILRARSRSPCRARTATCWSGARPSTRARCST